MVYPDTGFRGKEVEDVQYCIELEIFGDSECRQVSVLMYNI